MAAEVNGISTLTPVVNGAAFPRPTDGSRGDAGAFRTGFALMADEARRIEDGLNVLADKIQTLAISQAKMDGKLDALIQTKDDHEKRLRAVEQLRTQVVVIAAFLSLVVPAVVSFLLGKIQ